RVLALSTAVGAFAFGGPTMPATAETAADPPPLRQVDVPAGPLDEAPGPYEPQEGCMAGSTSGDTIEEKPWSQRYLGFERGHEQDLTGQNQTIAVIDTGVNHRPQLTVEDGGSAVPDGRGAGFDCDGHGT